MIDKYNENKKFQSNYIEPGTSLEEYYLTYTLTPKDGICRYGVNVLFLIEQMFNFT